jgi:tetratricopeptide (TPR) repeat protein
MALAGAYVKLNKFETAEELYQKALKVGRERQEPNVIGHVLKNMAEIRFELGKLDEALSKLQESYANASKHYGPEHSEAMRVLGLLGVVDAQLGNFDESKKKLTTVYEAISSEEDSYRVNALDQRTSLTDRNGTTRELSHDVLGRMVGDTVIALGTDVDGAVRHIGYAFNSQGLLETITSYSDSYITYPTLVTVSKSEYDAQGRETTMAGYGSGDTATGAGNWKYAAVASRPGTASTSSSQTILATRYSYDFRGVLPGRTPRGHSPILTPWDDSLVTPWDTAPF